MLLMTSSEVPSARKQQNLYDIIIDEPEKVGSTVKHKQQEVKDFRKAIGDSYHFNWSLKIEDAFQQPYCPYSSKHGQFRSAS